MKLAKLSLAAIVVAGLASSSFAADTLADAFAKGKVTGELKAWYFDRTADEDATKVNTPATAKQGATMWSTAATLGYVTDAFNGFSAGMTFQAAANPLDSATDSESAFANDQYTGGGVLSEAYIAYTMKNTTVKVGRQFISSPLVGGSASRIFTESFEGAVVINTDVPQTTLIAGYVNKFQGRTGNVNVKADGYTANTVDAGDAPKFRDSALFTGGFNSGMVLSFDGAYTAAAINKSINNLTLTAQYALVQDVANLDDVDVYYAEANYVLPMSGYKLGFDANFRGSKTGSNATLDSLNLEGTYTAVRASITELAGFGASFAYGTTSSKDSVVAGMGNGPTSYTSTMIRGTSTRMMADTDSYLFAATYDFSKIGVAGLSLLAQYGWTSQGKDAVVYSKVGTTEKSADYTNKALGLTYAVPYVKGLTTSLQYELQSKDLTAGYKADVNELWFKAGYKF